MTQAQGGIATSPADPTEKAVNALEVLRDYDVGLNQRQAAALAAAAARGAQFTDSEPADTQAGDTFNRPNNPNSIGRTPAGQAWTNAVGVFGLTGGRAFSKTRTGDSIAFFDSGVANGDFSVDVVASGQMGMAFRVQDATNYLLLYVNAAAGAYSAWVVTAGSFGNIATDNFPGGTAAMTGATVTLRARCNGTNVRLFINDTQIFNSTVASFATATGVGILTQSPTPNAQFWSSLLVRPLVDGQPAPVAKRWLPWNSDAYTPKLLAADTIAPRTFVGWANPSKEGVTLAPGDAWTRSSARPVVPVPFILDTDLETDSDDAMDVKCAALYHAEGLGRCLGVACTTSLPKSPGAARAILDFYGQTSIPVASYAPLGTFVSGGPSAAIDILYDTYPHAGVGLANTVQDTNTAIGQWLTASGGGVTYIMTGFAKGLRAFLQASAANLALFTAKVSKIVAVAGLYPADGGTAEYNLAVNAVDWNWLQANSPVPITWIGIEIGDAIGRIGFTYLNARQPVGDIMRFAIANHSEAVGQGRFPWGPVGMHYAIEGPGRFNFASVAGSNAINATTGRNTFTAGPGNDTYVTVPGAAEALKRHLESMIAADVVQGRLMWNGVGFTA